MGFVKKKYFLIYMKSKNINKLGGSKWGIEGERSWLYIFLLMG